MYKHQGPTESPQGSSGPSPFDLAPAEAIEKGASAPPPAATGNGDGTAAGSAPGPGRGSASAAQVMSHWAEAGPGDAAGQPAGARQSHDHKHYDKPPEDTKADSARFEGDQKLAEVASGVRVVKSGDHGLQVTKAQQALIDLGYLLPAYGVDGKFAGETRTAVLKFQKDHKLPATGQLDKKTFTALDNLYDTRKPYVDNAKHDPLHPGTRPLSADDKKAAVDAMVPQKGAGGAPTSFTKTVLGKDYDVEIKTQLTALIASFHKDLYEDKKPLRADPAKNFHTWTAMEGPGKASKQVVDKVYDTNYGGAVAFPAMSHAGGNFIDQWEDEEARNLVLTASQKKDKAREKVDYLIDSNCDAINRRHGAVPSGTEEAKLLKPVIDGFVSAPAKVQQLLDLDIGWEGAQLAGKVYLQRYKSTNKNKDQAKEENRVQMWDLFQTCIHEYLHTLAHPTYNAWASKFLKAGDNTRYNTLIEGFCDFFTLNVRSTLVPDPALAAIVEGPYANGNPPAKDRSGVYPSHAQAEQLVSIIGIKNAQAGYFQGKTELMGGP